MTVIAGGGAAAAGAKFKTPEGLALAAAECCAFVSGSHLCDIQRVTLPKQWFVAGS
jgi:hypothetical protein